MNDDGTWKTRSFWLETTDYEPAPRLDTSTTADVVIAGGGYTGLWTANFLKEADPSLDVVVIEKEICGYGGSGRNGGFAMTLLDFSLHHLLRNQGLERARAAHLAVARSVHEVAKFVTEHGIDCEFELNGYYEVATNPSQVARLRRDIEAAEKMGLEGWEYAEGHAARSRLDSPQILAGAFEPDCAILNPARLAHGLRRVAQERGVRVHDATPLTGFEATADGVRFHTPFGTVSAGCGVLALNPWTKDFAPFKRLQVPVYTYAMASEPLTDEQMDRIGWAGRAGVEDRRNYIHYFRLTRENRILWAGGDAVYYYGSRINTRLDRRPETYRQLESDFAWFFPQLAGLRFPYRWGGPVSITADFLPYIGTLAGTRLHYAFGCNGHGVAPAHTWGQVVRDLCLDRRTDLTELLFIGRTQIAFPPEPLRWIGAELTRRALLRQDRAMQRGREVGDTDPWILRVMKKLG